MDDTIFKRRKRLRDQITTMREDPEDKMTYDQIGDVYGVNKGSVWNFFNKGIEPIDEEIRYKMGLNGPPVEIIRRVARRDIKKGTFLPNP